MKLLFLAEGDPENPSKSGSGTPTSVIAHLRGQGVAVASADVDLSGAQRLLAAALTFSPDRSVWRARYHLGGVPLRLRSRNATRAVVRRAGQADAMLQYGGTFAAEMPDGVPYFLYCDNNLLNSGRQPLSWLAQLDDRARGRAVAWERGLYERAAGIFTFSDFVRRSFVADYGLPESRVVTVGSGPNIDPRAVPARSDRPRGESRVPTVLFVGRDFDAKGGPVLLDAFREVRERFPNARLLIAGPPTLDVVAPGVEFLGYLRKDDPTALARLAAAYGEADVFCLPTRYESFGIVILEAMFFGLPVVATGRWAIPEMIEHGRTGYLVEPDDARDFARRLVELLDAPARAAEMGRLGRARAAERFTWEHVTRRMRAHIGGVLGR